MIETKDHRKIKISDMETSHIKNTIKYLEKYKNFYDEYVECGYYICGGDGYIYCYETIKNKDLVENKIKELKQELNKRLEK